MSDANGTRRVRGAIHVHSTISYDGQHSITELATFFRGRGVDFVCMSEHSDGLGTADMERIADSCAASSDATFLMVPGIEFSCRRRLHILGLGVTQPVDSDDPLVVARHVRAAGGVAIVAHPLAYGADYPEAMPEHVDGLEIWNITKDGWLAPGAEPLALWRVWRRRNPELRGFGALDLHSFESPAGLTLELMVDALDTANILAALRSGPLDIRGRYLSISGATPPAALGRLGFDASSRAYHGLRRMRDRLWGSRA